MVAKFLDLNKSWSCLYGEKKNHENIDMYDLCMIALGNKAVAPASYPGLFALSE